MTINALIGTILIAALTNNQDTPKDSHPEFRVMVTVKDTKPATPISKATVEVRDLDTGDRLFSGMTDGRGFTSQIRIKKSVMSIRVIVNAEENASACVFLLPLKEKSVECSVPLKDEISIYAPYATCELGGTNYYIPNVVTCEQVPGVAYQLTRSVAAEPRYCCNCSKCLCRDWCGRRCRRMRKCR